MNHNLKDGGEREVFATGMIREPQGDRPRPSLVSPYFIERLAKHMTQGALKYADDNWVKGAGYRRFTDSIERHLLEWKKGDLREDVLSAMAFNIMCLVHFQETGRDAELNDMPDWGNLNEHI